MPQLSMFKTPEGQAPTLLLLGEHEVIHNPTAAQKRALKLISDIKAEIIPGAGHALNLDRPDLVNRRILEFLEN
jgi:pimeloyl-ACP methyl ester carboxylesterase